MHKLKQYYKLFQWILKGQPSPPPHIIKQRMVLGNTQKYKPQIMVETGTLLGDMVEAMKKQFKQIYSIEIDHALAQRARQRFSNDTNIEIIESDSAIALKTIVPRIHEPALFWLDGHYSGGNTGKGVKETPIKEELETILASGITHIIMIDDARCFGKEKDYPTIAELESYVRARRPDSRIIIKHDCIHILPKTN